MAKKKTVKFERADGPRPTRTGDAQAFSFKAPMAVRLPRGARVRVDLGVRASHPMQLFAARGLSERGVELTNARVFDAGEPLVVVLGQAGEESLTLEQGETVVRGIVLDNSDVSVEE